MKDGLRIFHFEPITKISQRMPLAEFSVSAILRQLMEIGTNVVRLSGGLLANKNRQGFRNFANENTLSAPMKNTGECCNHLSV